MKQEHMEKPQNLHRCALLLSLWLFVGCAGCGQKTATPQEKATHPPQVPGRAGTPTPLQTEVDTPTPVQESPILSAEWKPIQLPPDYNPYYGKSYFLITENNQKPPPPNEFYSDSLYWVPGWDIRSESYADGHGDSYLIPPERYPGGYEERRARVKEQRKAREKELGRTLTDNEERRISAYIYTEGLSNLHAAKFLANGRSPYAVEFAQKAHEENPDDFHTLFLLAHLQGIHENQEKYEPLAAANFRRILERYPNVARIHYEYARTGAYRDIVPRMERIAHLEKSLELDPILFYGDTLNVLALNHLGWATDRSLLYLKIHNTLFPNELTQLRIETIEQGGGWVAGWHK